MPLPARTSAAPNAPASVQELLQSIIGRAVNFAIMDKKRTLGIVSGDLFAGDVAGRRVIIVDDLISSGATVVRAINACRRAGATSVDVAATHASFAAAAHQVFAQGKPDSVVVTDSVPLDAGFSAYLNEVADRAHDRSPLCRSDPAPRVGGIRVGTLRTVSGARRAPPHGPEFLRVT